MYVFVCMCVCMYVCTYVCIRMYTYVCVCLRMHHDSMHACMDGWLDGCMYALTHTHRHTQARTYIYIYIHIHVHIHIFFAKHTYVCVCVCIVKPSNRSCQARRTRTLNCFRLREFLLLSSLYTCPRPVRPLGRSQRATAPVRPCSLGTPVTQDT